MSVALRASQHLYCSLNPEAGQDLGRRGCEEGELGQQTCVLGFLGLCAAKLARDSQSLGGKSKREGTRQYER